MLDRRRRLGVALLVLIAALVACGDDDAQSPTTPDEARDGGREPGRDASAGGGKRDAGSSQGGKSGSSSQGGASGDGRGDLDSIWKRTSSEITIIDPAQPLNVVTKTVEIPALISDPVDGHDLDAYQQIQGETLLTYAHRDGDDVYYEISQPLIKADATTYLGGIESGEQFFLSLEKGHLTETRVSNPGMGLTVSTRATFTAYAGEFPPSDWPAEKVVAP